jgi:ABC-type glutathione transport system ATPase component
MSETGSGPLLKVSGLCVEYPGPRRQAPVRVVKDVSFEIGPGETLGLIGESGSGKSTIGRAVLGLVKPAAGRIDFAGSDITNLSRRGRRGLTKEIQVVFQDPYSSLNPSMTVQDILTEPLLVQGVARQEAQRRVRELLDAVHLPANAASRLPREFSGGQRQRVAIARSLAINPRLVVCDEPVSGLDLKTQARVLDLLIELQSRTKVTYLFVSHDLSVIQHISHRVAVLLRGQIVESGGVRQVIQEPSHDYVKRLLVASPVSDPDVQRERRKKFEELTKGA